MRQATVQACRTARRAPVWNIAAKRPCPLSLNQLRGLRSYSSGRRSSYTPVVTNSSMHRRTLSFAVLSTVVASGAWYAYQGDSVKSAATQIRGFASTALNSAYAEDPTESTRRALLVSGDQFWTTTLSGDQPIAKHTDDSDRQVLEMLTPEQATQKLRKNEESYLVNRGKGVVRYDVVQVASNSPIEDDHAEKIVEIPASIAAVNNGEPSSDWMFWAVFDGHS
jgi:pyruvate dehydrogenase phosphatase